jgi:hypothetical protein
MDIVSLHGGIAEECRHLPVGNISNLPEDLIHEKSEQNMAENMEIKQTTFTRERYEQSISKSITSPRN